MRLKVDLHCEKCYKKVKKVLIKFPQIREQVFDEKQNIVTIKVECCSPEKLRDKLCCKGCGAIKSIEIVELPPPKEVNQTPVPTLEKQKKKKPAPMCCVPCSEGRSDGPCFEGCGRPPPCYHGYYYWGPVYVIYGGRRPCYVSYCDQYLNEDNATGCTIM